MAVAITSSDVILDDLFNDNYHYKIPIYQRHYVWESENWETLWTDIKNTCQKRIDGNPDSHFIGTIAKYPGTNLAALETYEIVDGQQRLTTFQIIFCAIRNLYQSDPNPILQNFATRAGTRLTNEQHAINPESPDTRYMLFPAGHDRVRFLGVVDPENDKYAEGRLPARAEEAECLIHKAYFHFEKAIREFVNGDVVTLTSLFESITEDFNLIQIDIDEDADPEKIFASLNATGRMLYEFDYLRNDLFLRARKEYGPKKRDKFYEDDWKFEEQYWTSERLNSFFKDFIKAKLGINYFQESNRAPFDIYREKLSGTVGVEFSELKKHAEFQEFMSNPDLESIRRSSKIGRRMQFYEDLRLKNLRSLILFLKHGAELSEEEFLKICQILESYIVRSMLCRSNNQNPYNNIGFFLRRNKYNCPVESLKRFLLEHENREYKWPDNTEVGNVLKEAGSKNPDLIRYILYRIELRMQNSGSARTILSFKDLKTLEYIVSSEELTVNAVTDRSILIDNFHQLGHGTYYQQQDLQAGRETANSIGNMVPLISNASINWDMLTFEDKKEILRNQNLKITEWIRGQNTWTQKEVTERTNKLFCIFKKIWEYPEL